jgi:glycogen debranching enzyme
VLYRLYLFLVWAFGYWMLDLARTAKKVLNRERLERPETEGLEPIEVVRVCLNSCLETRRTGPKETATVVCAGFRHFREPWARDFGFAAFGLMTEGRADVVEDGVRLFFRHQASSGQLPLKLHSTILMERYLHSVFHRIQPVDADLIPRFITAHGTRSLDSVLLLLIAWTECAVQTGNKALAVDLHGGAIRALAWIERYRDTTGLLSQGPFADWADSIARRGPVLYTNVLWWKALKGLEEVEHLLPDEMIHASESSALVGQRILGSYYSQQLGYLFQTPGHEMFCAAPNYMAVAWGLTSPDQSQRILSYAREQRMSAVVPSRVTDREYAFYQVGPEMRLAGIPHYHTSCSWMWIGGWHAVACLRAGLKEESREIVQRMLSVVERDRTVFEVHNQDGEPLATRLYHSEEPLSWNAAMILYAYDCLEGDKS